MLHSRNQSLLAAGIALPWLTSLANSYLRGSLKKDEAQLARRAVDNLEQLGPTFIKLGQILSIRPDILPPPVMQELAKLQVSPSPVPPTSSFFP